jgi:hypothetical protein
MSTQTFRGKLTTAQFPFVSTLQGRTAVQPQLDLNTPKRQTTQAEGESESNTPQVLFCENVIPTGEGYQSCTFQRVLEGVSATSTDFDSLITIRDTDEFAYIFSPAGGKNYIYKPLTQLWESVNPINAGGLEVSRAYVNGRTFICYSGLGIYEYNVTVNTFNKQTLTGITDTDIKCIGASNNYLLAGIGNTVHWSSLIDPLDFAPSVITGAGFQIPQDLKGSITAILGTNGGFIVYTLVNAVAANYSGNIRAPFAFKEIANAGGITSYEQVTTEQSSGIQYAWTSNGAQEITLQSAKPLNGEVNDFFTGRMYETYNWATHALVQLRTTGTEFQVKTAYIAGRYLVLSYSVDGSNVYQYALIYDTTLRRWGKVKIDHVDCFAYRQGSIVGDLSYDDLALTSYEDLQDTTYEGLATGIVTPISSKRSIGFLKANGEAHVLIADYNKDTQHAGVVIFGKFQLVRARVCTLNSFELEGTYHDLTDGTPSVSCYAMASPDGLNLSAGQPMYLKQSLGNYFQEWLKRITGKNVSVAVCGTFALSTYVATAGSDGDR